MSALAPPTGDTASRHILLCSLGASWAVVPEVWGWLRPSELDLYAHHPNAAALQRQRQEAALDAFDAGAAELWVCTTGGERSQDSIRQLQQWWQALGGQHPLRIWVARGSDQLATVQECRQLRELSFRLALAASRLTGNNGLLVFSLAGGRKTMSADMQDAASLFGAAALLHAVGPEPIPARLREADPALFLQPLPSTLAGAVTPLVLGRHPRSELLDIAPVPHTERFPVPMPAAGQATEWSPERDEPSLVAELYRRRAESSRVLINFAADLVQHEPRDNWLSLYRLPPADIEWLRTTPLSPGHRSWLQALPKAELHRHLGGSLDVAAQQAVAKAIWDHTPPAARERAMRVVAPLLVPQIEWPFDWPELLRRGASPIERAENSAAVLVSQSLQALEKHLFPSAISRCGLKWSTHGFPAYERPGDLSGSALLSHPAAIEPYAQALVALARDEGLAYVEWRGSPDKYRPQDPVGFLQELEAGLRRAGARTRPTAGPDLRAAFIWILDRRQREAMKAGVHRAVEARTRMPGFVLGLDLAGDEGTHDPRQLAPAFAEAFEACMPITIHAGEGEDAHSIWQAAYHLHADRVGHGLSLIHHRDLAQRFRDRNIALELCPTSNREVVGFADPAVPDSLTCDRYPLRRMLDDGLPVTLCTDNPGISRTILADEYLTAARMSPRLSLWESLSLIRAGFRHAMLPAEERDALLRMQEARVARHPHLPLPSMRHGAHTT